MVSKVTGAADQLHKRGFESDLLDMNSLIKSYLHRAIYNCIASFKSENTLNSHMQSTYTRVCSAHMTHGVIETCVY